MPAPQAALFQAAYGAQTAQMLYVAAKLGIADQLQHRHDTAAALAHTLGVNASALQRILRGLVSLGAYTLLDNDRRCRVGGNAMPQASRTKQWSTFCAILKTFRGVVRTPRRDCQMVA
jgi:DNA-binding IclR family transcriptional regulator